MCMSSKRYLFLSTRKEIYAIGAKAIAVGEFIEKWHINVVMYSCKSRFFSHCVKFSRKSFLKTKQKLKRDKKGWTTFKNEISNSISARKRKPPPPPHTAQQKNNKNWKVSHFFISGSKISKLSIYLLQAKENFKKKIFFPLFSLFLLLLLVI